MNPQEDEGPQSYNVSAFERETKDTQKAKTAPSWQWKGFDIRQLIFMAVALSAAFIIGYQAKGPSSHGAADTKASTSQATPPPAKSNVADNAANEAGAEIQTPPPTVQGAAVGTTGGNTKNSAGTPCTGIKGNISGKSKIYHVPGGAFYERTQEEVCFATEAEAQAAGFRKSQR